MKILAIDPSSSCCGHALWSNLGGRWVVMEHGRTKPAKTILPALDRVRDMAGSLCEMVRELAPDVIVVETMTERQYSGKAGREVRLSVCAFAGGYILGRIDSLIEGQAVAVSNVSWTRGFSKADRQAKARQLCACYDAKKDKGMDASDSICLGYWFIQRMEKDTVRRATR